jgi:Putative transposase
VLSLQSLPSRARPSDPDLRVNAHGFSLHAALRWRADQRRELEQLGRYITRPAIANERLKRNRAGQVVLQLKSPYKDGTTHIVMEPLEVMERLAALVPRPRLHLIPSVDSGQAASMACWRPTRSCAVKSFPLPQSVPPSPQPIAPKVRESYRA